MLLEGKRFVVTDGSRGIGRSIVSGLAHQGADVVINNHAGADRAFDAEAAEETVTAAATDINCDHWSDPQKRSYLSGRIPLSRFGEPADVGRAVAFLAPDMASYVTGAALPVDGGLFINLQ